MAKLHQMLNPQISEYKDRRFAGTKEQFDEALRVSTTIYVGNLAFVTSEEQIYELFSKVGIIKRIIMGLDKHQKTPCGFAFAIYQSRKEAESCVKYINGVTLDDRPIRCDFDWGFEEGRQFGRGRSGGQVRDEYRIDYDPGRGGYGKVIAKEIVAHLNAQQAGLGGLDDNASLEMVELGNMGYGRDSKRRRMASEQEPPKNPRFRDDEPVDEEDEDAAARRKEVDEAEFEAEVPESAAEGPESTAEGLEPAAEGQEFGAEEAVERYEEDRRVEEEMGEGIDAAEERDLDERAEEEPDGVDVISAMDSEALTGLPVELAEEGYE